MAEKGEKISRDYVIPKIDIVTSNFNSKFTETQTAPSSQDCTDFRELYLEAIAEGINEYVTEEFYYDVKTTGTIALTTTPPSTLTVTNYNVDGILETTGKITLKEGLMNAFSPTITASPDAEKTHMTSFFDAIKDWLPTSVPLIAVTGIGDNTVQFLSTVAGPITSMTWSSFISNNLATGCINEFQRINFVDSEGTLTGKDYKDVWDIIGKYIYQGLIDNVAVFSPVTGTANTTQVPLGTIYTAITTTGTIAFN